MKYFFQEESKDGSFSLMLGREELDNPHKPKTWHCFGRDFRVSVFLCRPEEAGEKSKNTTTTPNGS